MANILIKCLIYSTNPLFWLSYPNHAVLVECTVKWFKENGYARYIFNQFLKGDNFDNVQFAFLYTKPSEKVSTIKGTNLLLREQILSF